MLSSCSVPFHNRPYLEIGDKNEDCTTYDVKIPSGAPPLATKAIEDVLGQLGPIDNIYRPAANVPVVYVTFRYVRRFPYCILKIGSFISHPSTPYHTLSVTHTHTRKHLFSLLVHYTRLSPLPLIRWYPPNPFPVSMCTLRSRMKLGPWQRFNAAFSSLANPSLPFSSSPR